MLGGAPLGCATQPPSTGTGGKGSGGKGSGTSKIPTPMPGTRGPSTKKPDGAVDMGKKSQIAPKSGGPSLDVPGDEATVFAFTLTDVNDDGTPADCFAAYDDDGSVAMVCSPLTEECEDGSKLEAALLLSYDGVQKRGHLAIVGFNLCGSGYDVVVCALDDKDEIGACGRGSIKDGEIVIASE